MRIQALIIGLVAATAFAGTPADACEGSTEVFNVDFDDMPFGDDEKFYVYNDGKVVLKVPKGKLLWPELTDEVSGDIDLCVTFKVVKGNARAGFLFWSAGSEKWVVEFGPNGYVSQNLNGKWKTIKSLTKVDVKKGAENVARLTLRGPEGTAYLNGKQIVAFKRPKGDVESDYGVGLVAEDGDVEFSNFKGTSVD
jgi:hypothetical protein